MTSMSAGHATADRVPDDPTPRGLAARCLGVIVAPRKTFEEVVAAPRWGGMLALTSACIALAVFLFLRTDVGRDVMIEQQLASARAAGRQVPARAYEQLQQVMGVAAYFAAVTQLIRVPVVCLVVSATIFVLFNALLGGAARFKQLFTVVVHAGIVEVAQQTFSTPVNYFRGAASSPTTLAAAIPVLPEHGLATAYLAGIDLFVVWWLIVLAIGLAVLYKRRASPIAVCLLLTYGAVAFVRAWVASRP